MTYAASFSADVPAVSQQCTKALIRKIKAISSTSLSLKDHSAPRNRSSSKPLKKPVSSNQTPLQHKSPPSDTGLSTPKIQIIYSAKTHKGLPSPPPKSLTWTFPCPPEIDFPNETKLQLRKSDSIKSTFTLEDYVETTTAVSISEDIESSTDGPKKTLASSSKALACTVNLGVLVSPNKETTRSVDNHQASSKTSGISEPTTRSCARRGRGTLWTPQRAVNTARVSKSFHNSLSQTRLELDFCGGTGSAITVNLGRLTVSACNKPTTGGADSQVFLPRWLKSLRERNEESFHLDSALEYRVHYSDDPRLYDKFVTEAFARFQTKISRVVQNEFDWDNLRHIWD